jgi:Pyruvate/2-oxoacid:ferredoxin oxidoreductase gamma subunit
MQEAIETSVKPKFVELNLKAFNIGYEYALERV